MLVVVTLQSFVSSADLAIAISIAALSVSALRSGRRPRRMRSWLFFALASVTLVAHSAFGTRGEAHADAAPLFALLTLALFAIGFVLLYGSDREQLRSIETRAELDPTTGLLNRQAFRELVAKRLRRPRSGPSAVAVVDLDGFKAVNDSRGHPAGDEVLGLVATAIRANLRADDLAAKGCERFFLRGRLDGIGDDARTGRSCLRDDRRNRFRVRNVIARDREGDLQRVKGELCARLRDVRVFLRRESHPKRVDLHKRSGQVGVHRRSSRAFDLDGLGIDAGLGERVDQLQRIRAAERLAPNVGGHHRHGHTFRAPLLRLAADHADDPAIELDMEAGLLDDADDLAGADHAVDRVRPAHERLDARELAGVDVDLRLVVK